MTNANKRRGDGFERDVVRVLKDNGWLYADRALGAGRPADRGDIAGLVGLTVECKNHARLDLSGWLDDVCVKAERTSTVPMLIVKRRGRPTEQAYVIFPLEHFTPWEE